MTALLAVLALSGGWLDSRADRVAEAVAAKTKLLTKAGLSLSSGDRASLLEMERQYQDARAASEGIAECLGRLNDPDEVSLSRGLSAQRERLNVLIGAYGSSKAKPKDLLAKIRAFGANAQSHRAVLEDVRSSAAKLRFQAYQGNREVGLSYEVDVLSAPAQKDALGFSINLWRLAKGMRLRYDASILRIAATPFDKRWEQLATMKSSATIEVGLFNGDSLTYSSKDGKFRTTWERGSDALDWAVSLNPAGGAGYEPVNFESEDRVSRGRFCDVAAKAYSFVLEAKVSGYAAWKQSSVRNGVERNSTEKNPVAGVLQLKVLTL